MVNANSFRRAVLVPKGRASLAFLSLYFRLWYRARDAYGDTIQLPGVDFGRYQSQNVSHVFSQENDSIFSATKRGVKYNICNSILATLFR